MIHSEFVCTQNSINGIDSLCCGIFINLDQSIIFSDNRIAHCKIQKRIMRIQDIS